MIDVRQLNAGRCLSTSSLKDQTSLDLQRFQISLVSTHTMVDFKLPTLQQLASKIPEVLTVYTR